MAIVTWFQNSRLDDVFPASFAASNKLAAGFALKPYGAVKQTAVWKKPEWTPSGDKPIQVCWENFADSTVDERKLVRDAVVSTWGTYAMVSFVKWDQCQSDSKGIRIGVSKTESRTQGLGMELDGVKRGMLLQLDFTAFTFCKNKNAFCVKATAVHEFGHAIGLAHEQNRSDAPDWCKAKHSGDLPDKIVTVYDSQSIMNYCNTAWQNNGELSALDILAATTLYGARA